MVELKRTAAELGRKAGQALKKSGEEMLAATVTIAITGLARAGKTVFTTALAHNLSRAAETPALLPFLTAAKEGRIRAARLTDRDPNPFPYDAAMAALTGNPPDWPRPTKGVSALALTVDYALKSKTLRTIAPQTRLSVNVVDYPGEWLLDLPLLNMSFAAWSRDTLARCRLPPRAALAGEWLAALDAADGNRPAFEAEIARLADLYAAFLRRCRDERPGLYMLQPGRFLEPGALPDATLLQFCPFPVPDAGRPAQGSLAAALEARYERYRREIVRPFYRRYFSRFTRQVVLVDLLTALDRGPESWSDLQLALARILDNFHTERARMINRLPWIGARTEKLLFACAKADHVARNNYGNLRSLLRTTVEPSAIMMGEGGVAVGYEIVAAVKSTANVTQHKDGKAFHYIRGVPLGATDEQDWDPGDIPDEPPTPDHWPDLRVTAFRPPPAFDARVAGFRSINLDRALEFLIGDLFK